MFHSAFQLREFLRAVREGGKKKDSHLYSGILSRVIIKRRLDRCRVLFLFLFSTCFIE